MFFCVVGIIFLGDFVKFMVLIVNDLLSFCFRIVGFVDSKVYLIFGSFKVGVMYM